MCSWLMWNWLGHSIHCMFSLQLSLCSTEVSGWWRRSSCGRQVWWRRCCYGGQLDHPAWLASGAPVYKVPGTQSVCWDSMVERAAMAQNLGSGYLEVSIVLHCIWFMISWLVMALLSCYCVSFVMDFNSSSHIFKLCVKNTFSVVELIFTTRD